MNTKQENKPIHRREYCDHCEEFIVLCGTCGNNCCNGGYGTVNGLEPETTIECPDCPSAYDIQSNGYYAKHH